MLPLNLQQVYSCSVSTHLTDKIKYTDVVRTFPISEKQSEETKIPRPVVSPNSLTTTYNQKTKQPFNIAAQEV